MSTHFPVRPGLWQHVEVPSGTYSTRERNAARKVHILNLPEGGEGADLSDLEARVAAAESVAAAASDLAAALESRVAALEANQPEG